MIYTTKISNPILTIENITDILQYVETNNNEEKYFLLHGKCLTYDPDNYIPDLEYKENDIDYINNVWLPNEKKKFQCTSIPVFLKPQIVNNKLTYCTEENINIIQKHLNDKDKEFYGFTEVKTYNKEEIKSISNEIYQNIKNKIDDE